MLFFFPGTQDRLVCVCVYVRVENVSNKRVLGRRVFVPSVRKGQHLDINPLLMNGTATRVLIQHKAKKEKKKNGWEKRKVLCDAEQTNVGGRFFSCPFTCIFIRLRGRTVCAKNCMFFRHWFGLQALVALLHVLKKGTQDGFAWLSESELGLSS